MVSGGAVHGGYRPEIDGLRAVAVVPVVLYHAHLPGVSGGFVGVDVFFVISGFLITGLLAGDVAAGQFSIVRFYERRVRRIFPALFVMLGVSAALAVWLLLPFEMADFAGSLRAAALFVSNFYFRQETGYFVAAATTKPLLHTWSLAIEEQFYIFFPLWLYAMSRWARAWLLPATVAVLLVSLVVCIAMTHPQSDAAFFWTPARVWELLAGSVLALAPRVRVPGGVMQGLGAAGLVLIAVAVFGFDARTPFPGSAALLPVVGAGLVIFGCGQGPTLGGAAAVDRRGAVRRADLLLALPVALAADRVLPLLAGGAAGLVGDGAGGGGVLRGGDVVLVVRRAAVPGAGGAGAARWAVRWCGRGNGRGGGIRGGGRGRAAGAGAGGGAGGGRGAVRRGGFLGLRFAAGRAALRDRRGTGGGGKVRGVGGFARGRADAGVSRRRRGRTGRPGFISGPRGACRWWG